jgi:hypothetical protein
MNEPVAPVVEPRDPAASGKMQQDPAAPAGEQSAGLPEDLLRIPAVQALLVGQPGAVSASLADFAKRPEGQIIAANKDPLMAAGMGLYRSMKGDLGVLFNRLFVSDQEIMDADKSGTLMKLAPSFDEVNSQVSKAGGSHPILNKEFQTPTGFKTSPPPAVSAGAPLSAPPAPPKLVAGKARNIPLGSPTSGPKPGAGRLINQILKPVV